jgi:PIN domain nuclease of toxin-antitoxin system
VGTVSIHAAQTNLSRLINEAVAGRDVVIARSHTPVASQAFLHLSISLMHAQLAGRLTTVHPDPFDRMLAAQSTTEAMPIVSNDEALDLFGITRLW